MEIVFAHTRYKYDSYTDYIRLVELAGFPTCFVDEVDFTKECVYIVSPLNGEWRPHRDNHREEEYRARVIWWSLERPGWTEGMAAFRQGTKQLLDDWYFDECWLSDKFLLSQMHDDRVRFAILGSHEGLGSPRRGAREYDFAHMSYCNARRNRIYEQFGKRKIRLTPNAWGSQRDSFLRRSSFMLNVHQDDWPIIEPLRFSLAAAYALPLLTETCKDPYPYSRQGEGHYIVQAGAQDLVARAATLLNEDYTWWRAMGLRLRRAMTGEFEFGRMVRQAVKGLPEPSTVEIK